MPIFTHYEDTGDGPPVVLIHGHSGDLRMWQYQTPALVAAGFRVIRYDVRGHGRSSVPPAGYVWEQYAADLAVLIDALNVPAAHIAGVSMGGGIALQFALDYPTRVRSLALVDSALPGFSYSDEFTAQVEEMVAAVRTEGPRSALERLWLSHPFFDGVRRLPQPFALLREIVLDYPAADYREGATPAGYQPSVTGRLGEITAPALVVVGENDVPDFRLIAELLAANLPDARQLVIPNCWHLPPLEHPEAFNQALIAFMREYRA